MSRSLILGLDSATFDVVDDLIQAGRMPNFARMMDRGVHAEMRSTYPSRTPAAWVTFMTGVNPGKHGIFDFWHWRWDGYDMRQGSLVSTDQYAGDTFFDLLARKGRRVASLFVPMTFPAWDINGLMIAGPPLAPDSDQGLSHPPMKHKELGVKQDVHLHPPSVRRGVDREETVRDLLRADQERAWVALRQWDQGGIDCLMVVLESIDIVQHRLWHHFKGGSGSRFHDTIPKFYEKADEIVGLMLQRLKDDDLFFIVSDHGMMAHPSQTLNLNAWLAEQGWLKYAHGKATVGKALHRLRNVAHAALPEPLYVKLLSKLKSSRSATAKRIRSSDKSTFAIRWDETRAFRAQMPEPNLDGIMLNLKGRQPRGGVHSRDRQSTLQSISTRLEALIHPKSGERCVKAIFQREELYHGPESERMPDLIIELEEGFRAGASLTKVFGNTPQVDIDRLSGIHSPRGIFLAHGKPFAQGVRLDPIHIVDFAPNLLYAMSQGIPHRMDGEIHRRIFRPEFLECEPIVVDAGSLARRERTAFSEQEISQMEDRLRDLGYL